MSGLVLRNGLGAENLAWSIMFLFMPLACVYYPVTTLPVWLQPAAWALPPTYVFEGMRALLIEHTFRADLMLEALGLNAVFFAVGVFGFLKLLQAARRNGSLISNSDGEAIQYSLWYLQERGTLFVNPGEKVYLGMILGEHSRENDLDVNPIKEKKLTNIRAAGKDEAMLLVPPRRMSLEQAIAYIEDDELVEVTPSAVRLRKRHLDPNERKRSEKRADADAA